jgi:lipoprotein signal peptidase
MFNVFDKAAHNDAVIDYFALFPKGYGDGGWFIFNIPDFYITGGIIFACVAYFVVTISQIMRERKNKEKSKDGKDTH